MLGLVFMRALLTLATLSLASSCMVRAVPKDTSIEATFPAPAPASASTALPRALRVVTFNLHREPGDVILRGLREDRAIRDADLFVFQEVHRVETPGRAQCSAACALGKQLGYYSLYAPGHVQNDGTDGVAVLSRAPILSGEVIELPYYDVTFNSGRKIALAVTLLVEGQPVTVYAVHLDNRLTPGQRKEQLLPVLQHAAKQATPVLIAGDFNTSPFTWIRGVVPIPHGRQDNQLEALVRAHGFETPVVDSGPTFRYIGMRLDAIYTRGFDTKTYAVANAKYVSDHLALWAVVEPRGVRTASSSASSLASTAVSRAVRRASPASATRRAAPPSRSVRARP